uniref:Uncharacterized protein n=2 Tax=Tetranychus urticae TaxID=32264 RepID=T1KKX5_TETUR
MNSASSTAICKPVNGCHPIETSDQRKVNYDPSGNYSTDTSSIDSGEFVVDTGIPIKSSANHGSKLDKKPLLTKLVDNTTNVSKGSVLSTGRHLLDGSAFSHRSIVNLYSEYKQTNDRTVFHRLSFVSVIVASVLWISCWCGVLFLPLAMIVFGIIYRDDCPSIPELPGLLIFMGAVTTINNIVNVLDHIRNLYINENSQAESNSSGSSRLSTFSFFLNFVTLILVIYLAVIVFKHPSTTDDDKSNHFCSPVIYNFASWIIYLLGLLCLFIFVAIFLGCCYILWKPSRCGS